MYYAVPLGALLCLAPFVPAPFALVGGALLALAFGNPHGSLTKQLIPRIMAASITGLGAGMDLVVVGRAGLTGLGYTALGIAMAFLFGELLRRALRTDRITSILIAAGTAICGGSAIAAVAPVLRARPAQISVALGTVFLLNATALVLFPWIGRGLGLSDTEFGLWSALAIHDTSSVVGAAMTFGPRALEVGTTVKLARALWIVPLVLLLSWSEERKNAGNLKIPWFIPGFLAAAALVTWVPVLKEPGQWVAFGAKRLFVVALFFIGASFTREALKNVGPRILVQGVVLWLLVSAGSLFALRLGLIGATD